MNCFLGWCFFKNIRDVVCLIKLFLRQRRYISQRDVLAVLLRQDRNRDVPEGELVCSDVVKLRGFLELDFILEATDCLGRLDFDRERVCFSINKAEQS